MLGIYIPKGSLVEICDCGVPVYRVISGEDRVVADCETAGCIRPKPKLGGVGRIHSCKQARSA